MKNIINISAILVLIFAMYSCKKTDSGTGIQVNPALSTVTTNDATNITHDSALIGGNITNDGGTLVTEAGICYNTTPGVTIDDNRMRKYTISGNYSMQLKGLSLLTTYYYQFTGQYKLVKSTKLHKIYKCKNFRKITVYNKYN